jgi:hypothetical protein
MPPTGRAFRLGQRVGHTIATTRHVCKLLPPCRATTRLDRLARRRFALCARTRHVTPRGPGQVRRGIRPRPRVRRLLARFEGRHRGAWPSSVHKRSSRLRVIAANSGRCLSAMPIPSSNTSCAGGRGDRFHGEVDRQVFGQFPRVRRRAGRAASHRAGERGHDEGQHHHDTHKHDHHADQYPRRTVEAPSRSQTTVAPASPPRPRSTSERRRACGSARRRRRRPG